VYTQSEKVADAGSRHSLKAVDQNIHLRCTLSCISSTIA